jgi:hypothetical protein
MAKQEKKRARKELVDVIARNRQGSEPLGTQLDSQFRRETESAVSAETESAVSAETESAVSAETVGAASTESSVY